MQISIERLKAILTEKEIAELDTKENYVYILTESRVSDLEDDAEFLRCLRGAGVDNWEGYDYAIDSYNEAND